MATGLFAGFAFPFAIGFTILSVTTLTSPANAFEIFGWRPFGGEEEEGEAVPDPLPYEADLAVSTGNEELTGDMKVALDRIQRQAQALADEIEQLQERLS